VFCFEAVAVKRFSGLFEVWKYLFALEIGNEAGAGASVPANSLAANK
jgi:hypothetical protein